MIKKEYEKAIVYLNNTECDLSIASEKDIELIKESKIFDFLFEEVKKENINKSIKNK